MTDTEYLERVLTDQTLVPNGPELADIAKHQKDIEALLKKHWSDSTLVLTEGGSKVKGTMIKELYDLDLHARFEHDDTEPGETLEEIYERMADILEETYTVRRKRSAIRVFAKGEQQDEDLHIDVVPARFIDGTKTYSYLHQEDGDKARLMTNLDVHIEHVCDSGEQDAIRLVKLWKVRRNLTVKTFALELIVIERLKGNASIALPKKLMSVLEHLRDDWETLSATDPANPTGNDLSVLLDEGTRRALRDAADNSLRMVKNDGWQAVFGSLPERDRSASARFAATVGQGAKPWCCE